MSAWAGPSVSQPSGVAINVNPPAVSGTDWSGAGQSRWDQGIHPRIWFTSAVRDKVRGYAKKPGSLYSHLTQSATEMKGDVDAGLVPGQCLDLDGDGFQDMDPQGYNPLKPWDGGTPSLDSGKYMTEMYAQYFAFMSLVSPQDTLAEVAVVNDYRQRAHDLVMFVINKAKLGPYDEQAECVVPQQAAHPGMSANDATRTCTCRENRRFRSPKAYYSNETTAFLSADRGFITGDALPTAIDWVYDTFTAAELSDIRKVFGIWADELIRLDYYSPQPRYVTNSDATLVLSDPKLSALRFAINNHTLSYGRAIGMMALAVDKDPSGAAPLTVGKDGVSRRLEDFAPVAMDSFLRNAHIQRTTDGRGGMSPEGSMYSALGLRFELSLRLAMMTAGVNDPAQGLGRSSLYGHPFWDAVMPTYMQTLFNKPQLDINSSLSYKGKGYDRIAFGDVQSTTWQEMTDMDFFSMLGVYDIYSGQTNRAQQAKWVILHAMPGGAAKLGTRMDSALSQLLMRGNMLAYMLLDPDQPNPAEVADDPRTNLPPLMYLSDLGTYIGRTGWDDNASVVSYKNSWGRIDHNHQDGNSFDFVRKGRALTRKWMAYGQKAGLSEFVNTMAVKNYCGGPGGAGGEYDANNVFQSATDTLGAVLDSGSQQYLGASSQSAYNSYQAAYQANPASNFWQESNPMDPRVLGASDAPGKSFAYLSGDSTILYNRWDQYTPTKTCEDVLHASRALVWLKPDHLVVYDRAKTAHNGFKRFWLSLPPLGYTSDALKNDLSHIQTVVGASDVLTTVSLPAIQNQDQGGASTSFPAQQLFVRTLLPTSANVLVSTNNLHPNDGYDLSAGEGQIMRSRLKVEATGDPLDTRFLHVLQGADAGVVADTASVITANGMEGAVVNGNVVLFVKDVAQIPISFNYTAPGGVTKHIMTGLAPNAKYAVGEAPAGGGGSLVSVSFDANGAFATDAAGVLEYNGPLGALAQAITGFTPTTPVTLGAAPATLTATGGASGNPVVFSTTSLGSICTVSGTTLTYVGPGGCVLKANQTGNATYAAATEVSTTVNINAQQANFAVQVSPTSVTVNNSATLSTTGGNGLGAVSYAVTAGNCSVSGATVTGNGLGTCTIQATKAANGFYLVTTATVDLTVSQVALVQQTITGFTPTTPVTLGAAPATLTATGGASGNAVVFSTTSLASICTVNGTTLTYVGPGGCVLKANQAGNATYAAATEVSTTVTINSAQANFAAQVSPTSVTVNNSATLSTTGGNGLGAVSYAVTAGAGNCSVNGATVSGTGVGSCTITATKAANGYYLAATASVNLTVTPVVKADISVTMSDAPDPVTAGGDLTYEIAIKSDGPDTAVSVVWNDSLPSGTSFASLTPAAGWSCITPAVGVTGKVSCTKASMDVGTSAFTLVVTTSAGLFNGTILTNTVSVSSATSDPLLANNYAAVSTTLTGGLPPPVKVSIPRLSPFPSCGLIEWPSIVDFGLGEGPVFVGDLVSILSSAVGQSLAYVGQDNCGVVTLRGYNNGYLVFVPHSFEADDVRGNGVYPVGDGRYQVVRNHHTVTLVPAVGRLSELAGLFPGVSAWMLDNGVLVATINGVTYVVQPSVGVQFDKATGIARLETASNGLTHFIDSEGGRQVLYPAFAELATLRVALQAQDPGVSFNVQLDGTVLASFNDGQRKVLVPDYTLAPVPAQHEGVMWWQEDVNRFRMSITGPYPWRGLSQGFRATP